MASTTTSATAASAPNGQASDLQAVEQQYKRPKTATMPGRARISSRRREREAAWPEELVRAHKLLRRMIRPVRGDRIPTDAEVEVAPNQMVLDLCRQHPTLATEKFECHGKLVDITPLKFLIHNKANAEVIRGFCDSFPQTVQQVDGKNEFLNLDGYPLHLACTIRQDDGELISLLANAYPPAASTPNEGGFLPLHLLLEYRGFTPSLRGVQALIEIDPEAAIRKAPVHPPPIFSVLSSSQLTLEHMECIYSRLPRHVIRLDFPTNCFRDDCLSLDHARTIARILPQIQELNLQPPQWAPDAWLFFVQACQQHATSLRKLALKPPVLRPGLPSEVRTTLFQFIYGCAGLEMLDLQTSSTTSFPGQGAIVPDLTAPVTHLLTHGRLVSLRVMGYTMVARPIFAALIHNTQLKHLILHGLLPSPTTSNNNPNDPPALTLSSVLEHHNVTLQQAQTVHSTLSTQPQTQTTTELQETHKILYYTRLNRMGRAAARDHQHTTVQQMAHMLLVAQMDPELRAAPPRDGLAILYGLLRESPGLWSGTQSDEEQDEEDAGRKRKLALE